jgi:hypothetical protein
MARISRKEFLGAIGTAAAAAAASGRVRQDPSETPQASDRAAHWIAALRSQRQKVSSILVVANSVATHHESSSPKAEDFQPAMAEGPCELLYRAGDYRYEERRAAHRFVRGQMGGRCYRYSEPLEGSGAREVTLDGPCREQRTQARAPISRFLPILADSLAAWQGVKSLGEHRCEVVVQDQHRFWIDPQLVAVRRLEFYRAATWPWTCEEFSDFRLVATDLWLAHRILSSWFCGPQELVLEVTTVVSLAVVNGLVTDDQIEVPRDLHQ